MVNYLRFSRFVSVRRAHHCALFLLACGALLLASGLESKAQFGGAPSTTQVHDASALHPPAGARVAIVEFDDLECPACAAANPVLKAAAAKYQIPWIRHELLIPSHVWSPVAAVNARWFDLKSKALGDEYRDAVFANQATIYNTGMLSQFTANFARSHGIALPFAMDPQGKLTAEVEADNQLAKRTGIGKTPTIFIVASNSKGAPFIEVQNPQTDLYTDIDRAMADTKAMPPRTR
ncbi:MAG: thioredoxin domain-containing protein [Terracidiphilus sp.]|jgi:protein-disulfide isomerase